MLKVCRQDLACPSSRRDTQHQLPQGRLVRRTSYAHPLLLSSYCPQIVDKYIGESARLVREMFAYAREHEPCIIFMDEIDAIGGRRFSEGTSADREIQRTLMEVSLFFAIHGS